MRSVGLECHYMPSGKFGISGYVRMYAIFFADRLPASIRRICKQILLQYPVSRVSTQSLGQIFEKHLLCMSSILGHSRKETHRMQPKERSVLPSLWKT